MISQYTTGAYGRLQRYGSHAAAAPISLRSASHPHLARLDRPGPVAELPGGAQGRRRGPSTADQATADESALETRGRSVWTLRALPRRPGARAARPGHLGERPRTWRRLARPPGDLCQGSKAATRRQIEGISGQGEAGSGFGGGSSVDRTPLFTPMRRPWHPSRGRSEGPAARGAGRRTNGCQPAQRMSTPAAVRLMSQHRPAGISHAAPGKRAAFGNRLVGSSGPPGCERGSLVDMLLTPCRAQRIWQRLLKWHAQRAPATDCPTDCRGGTGQMKHA